MASSSNRRSTPAARAPTAAVVVVDDHVDVEEENNSALQLLALGSSLFEASEVADEVLAGHVTPATRKAYATTFSFIGKQLRAINHPGNTVIFLGQRIAET
jgi:hypothetical protein